MLPPLDQVIQESIHLAGGVELLGDPQTALSGKAGPVCELFDLSDEGLALLNPEATVAEQISVWREANLVADARRLLSHALPPRYSLWWALLTLTEAHRQKPYPAKVIEAVLGVRDFVLDPTEVGRRRCQVLADAADSTTAGGVIGYAAFLSGGSMAPPESSSTLIRSLTRVGWLAWPSTWLRSISIRQNTKNICSISSISGCKSLMANCPGPRAKRLPKRNRPNNLKKL